MISFQFRDFHIAKKDQDIGFYAGYVGELFYVFLLYLINDTQYGVCLGYECPHLIKCWLTPLQLWEDILPRLYITVNALYKSFTMRTRVFTTLKGQVHALKSTYVRTWKRFTYVCIYVYMCVCVYIYVCMYVCVCVYVCTTNKTVQIPQEVILTNILIPWWNWRVFIHAWQSSNICFVGNGGWPPWSKACNNNRKHHSVSDFYFHMIKLEIDDTSAISVFLVCLKMPTGLFLTLFLGLVWISGWP